MTAKSNRLASELRSAGASAKEIRELSTIASGLSVLKGQKRVPLESSNSARKPAWLKLTPFGVSGLVGVVLGMAVIVLSQTVLPGSLLYPIQKASDSLAIDVSPSYKGQIMMKRASQVKQLIVNKASSKLVLATLSEYRSEAAAYKSDPGNYADFEFCKDSLVQASALAPSGEKQAIDESLSSLQAI